MNSLKGKTLVITGSSRGIGKCIALRAARDGANIAILAKSSKENPKLPGTIYSAAEEVKNAGGTALPIVCDIRNQEQVNDAINKVVEKFGGIDILINNASALGLTETENTSISRFDLMHQINTRGTWLLSRLCLEHLKKSKCAHILTISPPLSLRKDFFKDHTAYTMSKYGMSMCTFGMSEEFKKYNIAVNCLWPLTPIYTAALQLIESLNNKELCRKPEIMADAAHAILTKPTSFTGNFLLDEQILRMDGTKDFKQYSYSNKEVDYPDDLFVDESYKKILKDLRSKI